MSLFSTLSVSASGMAAQRARTEVLVENLANSETTRTPEGGPYRRKDVVFAEDTSLGSFSSELDSALGPNLSGVMVSERQRDILRDQRPALAARLGFWRAFEPNRSVTH